MQIQNMNKYGMNGHDMGGHGMKMCRFFGSTNREVMRQVRLALGSEALIVSNRRVNGGVEILATDATGVVGETAVGNMALSAAQRPTDLMQAITDLRGEMAHRMEDLVWNQHLKQAPQALSLFQSLLSLGFSTALLRVLLKRLPAQLSDKAAFAWVRQTLVQQLPVCADEDALWRPGLALALVGPTGVGKTTTLAKLAARAVRRFGPQQVALLTTDTYRIGACEQLKIYGQILRVPVHVAHDADQLRRIVQGLSADHILLIDNVGVSQRDNAVRAQAAMLREVGRAVQRLLVLNAASHGETLDEVARNYRNDGGTDLAGCIISKCDEALQLAPALDTAIRHQLTIHYVSDGQKVPEHLSCLSAQNLVDQALMMPSSRHALYVPGRADMAALLSLAAPDAQSDQDAQRFFSGLLALSHPAGQTLSPDLVQQACHEIDEQSICAQAFTCWQAHHHAKPNPLDRSKLADALLFEVRRACAQTTSPSALVVGHDDVSVASAWQGRGRLYWMQVGSVLADGQCNILSSPLQSLQFANAWVSCCGASALEVMDTTHVRLQQVQWLQRQELSAPMLHVFGSGTRRLWRQLNCLGASWLTPCAPSTALVHEDTLTSAGALAQHATYCMLAPQTGLSCGVHPWAERSERFAVGFAVDAVTLRQRGQSDMPLRLIHVRLQDQRDGRRIRQWSALSHTSLGDTALVQVLCARMQQMWVARSIQGFWQRFTQDAPQDARHETTREHAWLAVHLGLAAWQMLQSGQARAAQQLLRAWCTSANPSVSSMASGLPRLFALKDMLR